LHHNVVLSGCLGGELCSALASTNGNGINPAPFIAYIDSVKSIFPNFYIELQNHGTRSSWARTTTEYEEMVKREAGSSDGLISLAYQTNTPTILTNDSHFQTTNQRTAHLMMTAQKRGAGRERW
jgi:DNA polymerase III alpha subunit